MLLDLKKQSELKQVSSTRILTLNPWILDPKIHKFHIVLTIFRDNS